MQLSFNPYKPVCSSSPFLSLVRVALLIKWPDLEDGAHSHFLYPWFALCFDQQALLTRYQQSEPAPPFFSPPIKLLGLGTSPPLS